MPEQQAEEVEQSAAREEIREEIREDAPQVQATAAVPPPPPPRSRQLEHLARIRDKVKAAIAARHTFLIHGRARVVRECLLARHWCEKLPRKSPGEALSPDSAPSLLLAGLGDLSELAQERALIARMLQAHTADLLWNAASDWAGWPAQDNRATLFNRFSRASFTSKTGLCGSARQLHWHFEAGVADARFPRCYSIGAPEQLAAFVDDFRATACLSLLQWLEERCSQPGGEEALCQGSSASVPAVPLRAIEFALGRAAELLASRRHEDIDREPERVWAHQWEQFVGWYYRLVHQQATFAAAGPHSLRKYLAAARHLLQRLQPLWPQLRMDGCLNVWILKPGNKSRGRGIVLMNRLEDILAKLSPVGRAPADGRFVVQKYIERPLLIYDTKFDIRQWFIVTSAQPLTLWMYRESYLRFCSQKFSLRDFHESIHLSNNAVQCKYKNSPDRDPALPADNMWDVASFKRYLAERGQPHAWEQIIYPGMKQGLVGSLLASQEAMDRRKNSFELYGADFMLMDDLSVWLIEINSHPDMSSSTSVTSRLCRKAIEDTIKVVVDYRESRDGLADTGDFELVYKQKLSCGQAYLGGGLSLHGTRIQQPPGQASVDRRSSAVGLSPASQSARKRQQPAAVSSGPALIDLIEELELQLDREFREYARLRQGGALARQPLPLTVTGPSDDSPEQIDAQTNTAGRSVDLGLTPSGQAQALLGIADSQPIAERSAVAARPSPRQRSGVSPSKQRTNLISKIIHLQRQPGASKSRSPQPRASVGVPPVAAANRELTFSRDRQPAAKLDGDALPNDKSVLPPPSSGRVVKNRLKDKKSGKKRPRAADAQASLDLTDMYAVGLSVSK